jgi:hypothetical protein
MNIKQSETALRYVEASSSLTSRLLDMNKNYVAQEKAASDKVAGVLDKMMAAGAIQPHQKAAADAMLRNPAQALDLLYSALDKMHQYKTAAEKANAELGQPIPQKEAGLVGNPVQQKSAGVVYLGMQNQPSAEVASVMASIMNDPR